MLRHTQRLWRIGLSARSNKVKQSKVFHVPKNHTREDVGSTSKLHHSLNSTLDGGE